ncbi:hypothetical protein GOB86_14960 [Acetobacter lambici]|uniref:Uncharacterized protein n=1 Tax=Acetobacter lambici TaxID=1332824 RepID=A0ABT1F4E6_9PROT|nr:hypothetical protein [Acetobacter lambici]MCP1243908.1 hypothetical protein [Acetobacter lambici]MCP1260028.1 hypothetical protein [Acetobacter lambici]NHO58306.1 hypothetical protein [Acetobacter lambici]
MLVNSVSPPSYIQKNLASQKTESSQATSNKTAFSSNSIAVDFTNMSRQELRDWSNEQIKSGKMTLDDASPFMFMSLDIPVSGDYNLNLNKKVDFFSIVKNGLEGAKSNHDFESLGLLEKALHIMKNNQTNSVDITA